MIALEIHVSLNSSTFSFRKKKAQWATLPAFWGSFYNGAKKSHQLSIPVFDFDTPSLNGEITLPESLPSIGQQVSSACMANVNRSQTNGRAEGTLGYWIGDTNEYTNLEQIEYATVDEKWWAAVVILPGATSSIYRARSTGDPQAWDPTAYVKLLYNQARNENAAGASLCPSARKCWVAPRQVGRPGVLHSSECIIRLAKRGVQRPRLLRRISSCKQSSGQCCQSNGHDRPSIGPIEYRARCLIFDG